eukprot:3940463-Rhodomonas_salina.3
MGVPRGVVAYCLLQLPHHPTSAPAVPQTDRQKERKKDRQIDSSNVGVCADIWAVRQSYPTYRQVEDLGALAPVLVEHRVDEFVLDAAVLHIELPEPLPRTSVPDVSTAHRVGRPSIIPDVSTARRVGCCSSILYVSTGHRVARV